MRQCLSASGAPGIGSLRSYNLTKMRSRRVASSALSSSPEPVASAAVTRVVASADEDVLAAGAFDSFGFLAAGACSWSWS